MACVSQTLRQTGLHLTALRPKAMPSSGPKVMVVLARRRAGACTLRAFTLLELPLPLLARYTDACRKKQSDRLSNLARSLGQQELTHCVPSGFLKMPLLLCARYTDACRKKSTDLSQAQSSAKEQLKRDHMVTSRTLKPSDRVQEVYQPTFVHVVCKPSATHDMYRMQ